jgi:hypothetical protein
MRIQRAGLLVLTLLAGCVGQIGDANDGPGASRNGDDPQVTTAPIARLTNTAYVNTLGDLFPGWALPTPSLPADVVVGEFDNNSLAQSPAAALIDIYSSNAEAIAATLTEDLPRLLGCSPVTLACGQTWALDFARRAYRHPLSTQERDRLIALYTNDATGGDVALAVSLVIQGVLQSSSFLYRAEVGVPVSTELAALTDYEIASRLSYFLWESMPDEALLGAAADNALSRTDGIAAEARRMLDSPKARAAIARFQAQWLRFDKVGGLMRDSNIYPSFDADVGDALSTALTMYVDKVFWDLGTLEALLTDSHAFVNDALAPIYDVDANGSTLQWTDVGAARRSGILTQAGLLAAFAHPQSSSPVLRGVFVLERLLCAETPPPPPGVQTAVPPPPEGDTRTGRERLEQDHEQGSCAACHRVIDGVGFGFEHYDAIGAWRDTENGKPIDASGTIVGSADLDGPFNGAIELGQKLAHSEGVRRCVTAKFFEYGLGLDENHVDEASVAAITAQFAGTDFDMRELIIQLVTSDTFRYRVITDEASDD